MDSGVAVQQGEQLHIPFSASAARTARHHLSSFLHEQNLAQPVVDDALVVISELVANAVRHATPQPDGSLGVSWALADGALVLTVADGGSSRAPQMVSATTEAEGGRGLSIVSLLARRWWVEQQPDGLRVNVLLHTG